MAVEGENYMLVCDMPPLEAIAKPEKIARDITHFSFPFSYLFDKLSTAGASVNIVVLDACREDPYQNLVKTRGVLKRGGLAKMPNARGTLVCYSCEPNSFAQDSPTESNSVFSKHLKRHIGQNAIEINEVFKKVTRAVMKYESSECCF